MVTRLKNPYDKSNTERIEHNEQHSGYFIGSNVFKAALEAEFASYLGTLTIPQSRLAKLGKELSLRDFRLLPLFFGAVILTSRVALDLLVSAKTGQTP